jgi:ribosomal protein S18 acetylase RimI-like enzyme
MSASRLITPVTRALVRNRLSTFTRKKTVPSIVPGVSHQLVVPEQYEEVVDLYNKYFTPGNPLYKYLGCTEQSQAMDNAIFDHLKENLSWCAIEEKSGKMIGMCVNRERSLDNLPDTLPTYEELLEQGYSKELALTRFITGSILNMKQLLIDHQETKLIDLYKAVVHPEHTRRGIATELFTQSMKHGAELGYRLCYTTSASFYAQRILERIGFQMVKEIEYASYIHPVTNTCLFKDMEEPHKHYKYYVQKLC